VIELVAITDATSEPPPPLRAVRSGGLWAICAPAAADEHPTAEDLWRHEALLEELMEERDLLPVRFGTRLPDQAAARDALEVRHGELTAALERVRGAVELALRVEAREPVTVPPAGGTGRDYLAAKAATRRTAAALHAPLAAISRASALRPGRELLRAAYLVDRGAVDAFVSLVGDLQRAHEDTLALVCTGPWPPFSFAEEAPGS
jgi:hypothetical protein